MILFFFGRVRTFLWKATISFVLSVRPSAWNNSAPTGLIFMKFYEKRLFRSVRPSVRMEHLVSHWTDFHEIWYLCIFRKSLEKIQVQVKSDKKIRNFVWRHLYICYFISMNSSKNEKCCRQSCRESESCREIERTYFIFSNCFCYKRAVLWDTWKNVIEPDRPHPGDFASHVG
jgi:hypothetical protein